MGVLDLTLGDIKRRIRSIFGDESGALITDEDIRDWANDAQVDIARKTGCLQSHKQTTSVIGEDGYDLPDDFLVARRVTYNGNRLLETTIDKLDLTSPNRQAGTSNSTPKLYYVWAGKLFLYPPPSDSSVGGLDLFYGRAPQALETDNDVSELPPHLRQDMERFILSRAKEKDEEFDQSTNIRADYELQLAQIKEEQNQPQDSYPSVRTLPGDDW